MKKVFVLVAITIGVMSCEMNKKEVQYLSTTLSDYSEKLAIVPSYLPKGFVDVLTYAKLETGLADFQVYTGTGKQGNTPAYWMQIGSAFILTILKKDESLNICRDTIKYKLQGDTTMVAFELTHYLSTDEIQYAWLDEHGNRSEKAIIIDIDHPLRVGKMFPDLTVEQLDGKTLSFSSLMGKIVVVNWWQTTCGPCRAEMPGLNQLVEQHKDNQNIVFVAIAHNKKEDVARFLESSAFRYTQTLAGEEALRLFGGSYPKHIIINAEGKISTYSAGGSATVHVEIEKGIKELLD